MYEARLQLAYKTEDQQDSTLVVNYDTLRDKSTLIPLYDVLQGHCAVRHKAELHRGFFTLPHTILGFGPTTIFL